MFTGAPYGRCTRSHAPFLRAVRRYSAVDVFKGLARLRRLRTVCLQAFERGRSAGGADHADHAALAEVQADSLGWSRRLGHYTNFANLLRLAALAVPGGFTPCGLPGGITCSARPAANARLCELGLSWQRTLEADRSVQPVKSSSASGSRRGEAGRRPRGAGSRRGGGRYLRGQPLHPALLQTGAASSAPAAQPPRYRFMALMDLPPPRPGLLRDDDAAGAVAVEIYDLPLAGFGALVASVAPPLAIGTVELEDGEAVKGFLCESCAAALARDITEFGGWLAFREHLRKRRVPKLPSRVSEPS